jgi:hypothetical protein
MAEVQSKEQKREIAKAKKLAREAVQAEANAKYLKEQAEKFAAATVDYKDRLLAVIIEYASIEDFYVHKNEIFPGKVFLKHYLGDNRTFDSNEVTLKIIPETFNDLYELEQAEIEIRAHYEKLAEEKRLAEVRKVARAKLTDEEAKALGLR